MENQTDILLEKIDRIYQVSIPQYVYDRARKALLDYLGVTLAGTRAMRNNLKGYFDAVKPEEGEFKAIGIDKKLNLKDAVFLNGLNAHALDYDDGTNSGIIHLGSPIFSVLLPLTQRYRVSLKKLLKSVVVGYEMSYTMAITVQPRHKELGYHATGTCGVLGIAVAASYLLDYTVEERKRAVAFASASATGVLQVLDDGSELKPYNVAKTCLMGLVSVQMAKCGFKVHPDPIGGERGFLKMMAGNATLEIKKPLQEGKYAIERAYVKPYAACRYCHPAIEAAICLREKIRATIEEIDRICVRTYALAVKKHDHVNVMTVASAKMSIPYGVAVGLIYGKAGLNEYRAKYLNDIQLMKLVKKVFVEADEKMTKVFPEYTYATVEIYLNDGSEYEETIALPKGEPENPLTEEEFYNRFVELAVYGGKTKKEAEQIVQHINGMNGLTEFTIC